MHVKNLAPALSSLARNTALFSSLTILSRLTGLVNMIAFNAVLGSGRIGRLADSYHLAHMIPNMVFEFIAGGLLSAMFIPVLIREQERHGKTSAEAWGTANLLLGYVGLLLAAVSILCAVFAPQVVWALTFLKQTNTDPHAEELATFFLRYFAPQMFFLGLNSVFMAILNSHNVFGITAAAPIINNLVVIATLLAFRAGAIGTVGLAIGTTAGIAAMTLAQLPWLIKSGMPIRPRLTFHGELLSTLGTLGAPLLILSAANFVGSILRANLLWTVDGGYTAYHNSFRLVMMPYGIFAVSIATVLYPALSRFAAGNDSAGFREIFSRGMRWMSLICIPISVGIAVLAEPIVRVLFERGRFTGTDTLFNASFLRVYALTIFPFSLAMLITRGFYSQKNTITPTWINVTGVAINLGLNFWLLHEMGVTGIALSSVVTYCLTVLFSFYFLRRITGKIDGSRILLSFAKFTISALAMSAAVLFVLQNTEPHYRVLQKSQPFPGVLPAGHAAGASVVIKDQQTWQQFWNTLSRAHVLEHAEKTSGTLKESPAPSFDFNRNRIIAVFGPMTNTTSTLVLQEVKTSGSTAVLSMALLRSTVTTSSTQAARLPARSYMLATVRAPVEQAETTPFKVTDSADSVATTARDALFREAVRLALLILLGILVYTACCMIMRADEPASFLQIIRRKIRKQPTGL